MVVEHENDWIIYKGTGIAVNDKSVVILGQDLEDFTDFRFIEWDEVDSIGMHNWTDGSWVTMDLFPNLEGIKGIKVFLDSDQVEAAHRDMNACFKRAIKSAKLSEASMILS